MSSARKCPFPGGEASTIGSVHVTREVDAARTLETHQIAFRESGLEEALSRVIAIVVQPGVEFDHTQIIHYQPQAAQALPHGSKKRRWSMKRIRLITKLAGPTAPSFAIITPF